MVLGLTPPPDVSVGVVPGRFRSRNEYRRALIDSQSGAKKKERVERVTCSLTERGLAVHAYPSANTVVVEGQVGDLDRAIDEDLVETASFDDELGLIEPVG